MAKICNQLFVKDKHRNQKFPATVKCVCCGEETNLHATFPFEVKQLTNFLADFVRLHKNMGCNTEQLSAPEWAAKEVNAAFISGSQMW